MGILDWSTIRSYQGGGGVKGEGSFETTLCDLVFLSMDFVSLLDLVL